jgi:hypothetical protein
MKPLRNQEKLFFMVPLVRVVTVPAPLSTFKKRCHPETCPSAGEGPSLKPQIVNYFLPIGVVTLPALYY